MADLLIALKIEKKKHCLQEDLHIREKITPLQQFLTCLATLRLEEDGNIANLFPYDKCKPI